MTIEKLNSSDQYYTAYVQVNPMRDPDDGMFPFTYWLSYAYDYSDIDSSILSVDVPPGSFVMRVIHCVATALTGATAVVVGDDDTADGWIQTGFIVPGTAGNMVLDETAAFVVNGKRYPDGDHIDIEYTGTVTAGTGKIFIEVLSYYEDLTDD